MDDNGIMDQTLSSDLNSENKEMVVPPLLNNDAVCVVDQSIIKPANSDKIIMNKSSINSAVLSKSFANNELVDQSLNKVSFGLEDVAINVGNSIIEQDSDSKLFRSNKADQMMDVVTSDCVVVPSMTSDYLESDIFEKSAPVEQPEYKISFDSNIGVVDESITTNGNYSGSAVVDQSNTSLYPKCDVFESNGIVEQPPINNYLNIDIDVVDDSKILPHFEKVVYNGTVAQLLENPNSSPDKLVYPFIGDVYQLTEPTTTNDIVDSPMASELPESDKCENDGTVEQAPLNNMPLENPYCVVNSEEDRMIESSSTLDVIGSSMVSHHPNSDECENNAILEQLPFHNVHSENSDGDQEEDQMNESSATDESISLAHLESDEDSEDGDYSYYDDFSDYDDHEIYPNESFELNETIRADMLKAKIEQHTFSYKYQDASKDSTTNETCSVCLSSYIDQEEVRRLPCFHLFHTACVDPTFNKRDKLCPICRANIEVPIIE